MEQRLAWKLPYNLRKQHHLGQLSSVYCAILRSKLVVAVLGQ